MVSTQISGSAGSVADLQVDASVTQVARVAGGLAEQAQSYARGAGVGVVAAGERWPGGGRRPAVEDCEVLAR